jgi:hypothetical protein
MNIERHSSAETVVLFHDTVPLDERTQRRRRVTRFWSGDIWKLVVCLKEKRPDLRILTIATPPTGLTVVSGLDPRSGFLQQRPEAIASKYVTRPFASIEASLDDALNMIPNDWEDIRQRLGLAPAPVIEA